MRVSREVRFAAPAVRDVGVELGCGEIRVAKVAALPGYPGYVFGLEDSDQGGADTEIFPLADLPDTDQAGKASFTAELSSLPATTKPLEAEIVVRMA